MTPVGPPVPLPVEWSEVANGSLNSPTESLIDEETSLASDPYTAESDGRFDELIAWKRARRERLARLMKIVDDREAAAAREAKTANLAVTQATNTTTSAPNNAERQPVSVVATETYPSPEARVSSPPSTLRPAGKRQEKWEETLARWRRSLPDWRFALPLLVLPWLVWNYWPLSQSSIAETYRSMYAELRRFRDLPENKTGMTEFVAHSQTQLDELLPKLKPRATAKNPDAQMLYWMGHDCLKPMLKYPRQRNTKHEDMLKKLLAQWDRGHGITPAPETPDPSSESLPPVSPSVKGLGFGKSAEPSVPVDVQLPLPSAKSKAPREQNQDLD